MDKKIKVMVADDHEMIVAGLKSLLADVSHVEFLTSASNGKQLLELIKILPPDIILMDLDMPEMNGIEATSEVKKTYPEIKIIALTVHDELGVITKLKEAGVDGYLLKNTSQEELINAMQIVHMGGNYYSAQITNALFSSFANPDKAPVQPEVPLTTRELEILRLIAEGMSNTEIGAKLFISHRTVDTHRTNLMKKLNVSNIAGLIKFAFRSGLVE